MFALHLETMQNHTCKPWSHPVAAVKARYRMKPELIEWRL
jgi:hypothetical protein